MRCRICDSEEADVVDPKTQERLCWPCASSIQETIGTEWVIDELSLGLPELEGFDYRDDHLFDSTEVEEEEDE